jgi:hypothetical protein
LPIAKFGLHCQKKASFGVKRRPSLFLGEQATRKFGTIDYSAKEMVLMQRREVLRILATGTALQLAPAKLLVFAREVRTLMASQAAPRTLNVQQAATVTTIAELILPRTDTPGATDVGATAFIDLILTEWYDDSDRSRFLSGLADVDARSQRLFGKNFVDCPALQQSEILSDLGAQMMEEAERLRDQPPAFGEPPADVNFYSMLRRLVLTAYYTSEAGATQELHFEMIPDRYEGCAAPEAGGTTAK